MSTALRAQLSQFALDVAEGLSHPVQKQIPSRYFYDALGSSLFEAITLLPEYGLTRADEGLLRRYARDIVRAAGFPAAVAELGSGCGSKARFFLEEQARKHNGVSYFPIDVSSSALAACSDRFSQIANVIPICADWEDGLNRVVALRTPDEPLLVLFLGSSIGNLDRSEIPAFLCGVRSRLNSCDSFLLGADLVKDVDIMLAAYDDPTGVTAAFNLNVLGRMNRELGADFDLRAFSHEVRWNSVERRIEMHLLCIRDQTVYVGALERAFEFCAGETIWTESSHKFTQAELDSFAFEAGFRPAKMWIDQRWPFAEVLWKAA